MKLRKCFSLLVIFALCIVLAACSKENDQAGNADNSNINTVTEGTEEEKNIVTETVTPEPENTTAVTDIVTPGPESTLTGVYNIFVTDTTGAPVEGATIQFCSDTECRTGKTDSAGKVEFDAEAGKYEVHVLKAPEGYVKDTVIYVADDSFSDITIVLEKEQNEEDYHSVLETTGLIYDAKGVYRNDKFTIAVVYNDIIFSTEPYIWATTFYFYPVERDRANEFYNYLYDEFYPAYYNDEEIPKAPVAGWENWIDNCGELYTVLSIGCNKGKEELDDYLKNYQMMESYTLDEIGKSDDCTFFLLIEDSVLEEAESLKDTMNEEYYKLYKPLLDNKQDFIDSLSFTTPLKPDTLKIGDHVSFDCIDMDGNPVNSTDIFKDYKITMINVWGTYCGPCINELPELGKMAEEYKQKDVQIIGICFDAVTPELVETAKSLFEENGCTYPDYTGFDDIDSVFPSSGVPATFFVDSEGYIIAEPIIGAYLSAYGSTIEKCLENMGD